MRMWVSCMFSWVFVLRGLGFWDWDGGRVARCVLCVLLFFVAGIGLSFFSLLPWACFIHTFFHPSLGPLLSQNRFRAYGTSFFFGPSRFFLWVTQLGLLCRRTRGYTADLSNLGLDHDPCELIEPQGMPR